MQRMRALMGRTAGALDLDVDDARTLIALAYRAAIVVGAAATFGTAVRVFSWTSGIGGQ